MRYRPGTGKFLLADGGPVLCHTFLARSGQSDDYGRIPVDASCADDQGAIRVRSFVFIVGGGCGGRGGTGSVRSGFSAPKHEHRVASAPAEALAQKARHFSCR